MSGKSVPQVWDRVEATVTIRFVANESDGAIIINVDQARHLLVRETLALAMQALGDRLVQELMPVPGLNCESCGSALQEVWSKDWAYAVMVCPGCGAMPALESGALRAVTDDEIAEMFPVDGPGSHPVGYGFGAPPSIPQHP